MSWWKKLFGVRETASRRSAPTPKPSAARSRDRQREPTPTPPLRDASTLHKAAKVGNAARVEEFIANGTDPNAKDGNGNTPLILASSEGHTDVVIILLAHKASPNIRGVHEATALHFAAQRREVEIAKLLIQAGADHNPLADDGRIPLHFAAGNGHVEMVKYLLDNGANKESNRYVPGRFMDWNVPGLSAQRVAENARHVEVAKLIAEHKG